MIQRATTADPVLDQITRPIVERFHPSRIILFGSRARGDARADSDYDVMVELETELPYYECRAKLYGAVKASDFSLNIFLRAPGRLEERRDDPGTLDWHIAREGILLYSANSDLLGPLPSWPGRVREGRSLPPPSVAEWLKKAAVDLDIIRRIIADDSQQTDVPWGGVAFHAQQAAEKYLKALFIMHVRKPPPRTHELVELAKKLRAEGCPLPDLEDACRTLDPYAVDVRYPDDIPTLAPAPIPDEAAGRAAVDAAYRIIEAAKLILP